MGGTARRCFRFRVFAELSPAANLLQLAPRNQSTPDEVTMRSLFILPPGRSVLSLLVAFCFISFWTNAFAQPAPDITQPPQSQTVVQGTNVTFTVVATGQTPFTYQWWRNGAALSNGGRVSGAQAAQLNITGVLAADAGSYTVTVYDRQGDPTTSSPATLTVLVPPSISQQPQSRTNLAGTNITFTATATGIPAPALRWLFNGAPLADAGRVSGAATGTLSISNLQPADAGNYQLVATNSVGSVTSAVAQLVVWVPPTFSLQPEGRTYTYFVGNDVTFTSHADGIPAVSYQWFRDGNALTDGGQISGAQAPSLTLGAVQTNNEGAYWVVAANAAGAITSAVAVLDVLVPVSIVQHPQPTNVVVGGTALFSVVGAGDPPLTYRWAKNGSPLDEGGRFSGVFTPVLTISNVQPSDSGPYSVEVFGVGSEVSANAMLAVLIPPAFTNAPLSTNVAVGNNFTLTATATGTAPVGYQWFFNDAPLADDARISGAQTTVLAVSAAETNDSGVYWLVASNVAGVTTSTVASVSVGFPPVIALNPVSQTNGTGSTAQFLASATGTEPLGYRWFLGTTALSDDTRRSGTTTTNLSITSLVTGDSGNYTLVVTNASGSATSAVAVLTVLVPPAITTQPIGKSVPPGLPVVFTSFASGSSPLTYQWQLNGMNLPGAMNRNYTNLMAGLGDAGDYRVIAANAVGAATSVVAQLTIGNVAVWGGQNLGAVTSAALPPPNVTNAIAIDGGSGYSLALNSDGTITAWGGGTATNVPPGLSGIVSIAAGLNHALALRSDGTVVAWGFNNVGQTNVPATLSNVVAIAAGGYQSAAVRADGTVAVWGSSTPTNLPTDLQRVAATDIGLVGKPTMFALKTNGSVVAWGGDPKLAAPNSITNVAAIAVGGVHAMALTKNGKVVAWGNTAIAQVTNVPPNLGNIVAIAAGPGNGDSRNGVSYAIESNGIVRVWGFGFGGETNIPPGLSNAVAVAAGYNHALALVSDGRPLLLHLPVGGTFYTGGEVRLRAKAAGNAPLVFQWFKDGALLHGANADTLVLPNAQFTNTGTYQVIVSNALGVSQSVPVPVTIVDSAPKITWPPASSFAYHGSPFSISATVIGSSPMNWQWLQNGSPIAGGTDELTFDRALPEHGGSYRLIASNAFGSATSSVAQVTFTRLATWGSGPTITNAPVNLGTVTAVAAGHNHLLALKPDGTVAAWGTTLNGATNVPPDLNNVVALSGGYYFSVARRGDGTAVAWGLNNYGQTNVPTSATNLTAISAGGRHVLGLRADGTVVAWGDSAQTNVPVGLSNVVAIAAGYQHSLALTDNGKVVGWGASAGPPAGLSNVVAVAAGDGLSLALRWDGSVVAWGTGGGTNVPSGASNVVAIAAGGVQSGVNRSAALQANGTMFIWGNDKGYGQFSDLLELTSGISLSCGGSYTAALLNDRSPAITVQPWNRRVNAGANLTLAAFAAGQPPLHYQWRFNGADLPEATNATLNLPAVTRAQRGAYSAFVWNEFGSTNSRAAQLDVGGPLQLLAPEFNAEGGLSFSAMDSFGAPLTEADLAGIAPQASTNLVDWTTLANALTLSNGVLHVTDPAAANHPTRFYRLVEP
jgi:alpha-tubulin suppressor-like RCC1 family protein